MKNYLVTFFKAVVTILLLLFLFRGVNFAQFLTTLRDARMAFLFWGFVILWIGHYLCLFRWRILMRPLMPVLSLGRLFGIYCIGLFFNLAFPTLVGGDLVKVYYAGKPSKLYARSFAATFLDRDVGLLAMMMIACLASFVHRPSIPGVPVQIIVWTALVAFLLANAAIFAKPLYRLCNKILRHAHMLKVAARLDTLSEAFQIMGRERPALAASLAISLANQLLVISVVWVMSEGLRLNISFLYFLVFVPIITLISMIPVTLNGMGLREYAYMTLFGAIGVAPESCIALGLLASAVIILSAIPGGVVYVFFRTRSDLEEMSALEVNFS